MLLKDVLTVQLIESSIANVILEPTPIYNSYFSIFKDEEKSNHLSDLAEYLARQIIFNKFHTYLNCVINNSHPIDWVIDTFAHVMNEILFNYSLICLYVIRNDDETIAKNISDIYAIPITSNIQVIGKSASYNTIQMTQQRIEIINKYLEELIKNRLVKEIVAGLITVVNIDASILN